MWRDVDDPIAARVGDPDPIVGQIVVVGGGSAGWIAACRIAAANPDVRVTLIESARIGTIGVGEGTWPTMRNTLKKIGIGETAFIRACDAAFKQGARFNRWTDGSPDDGYYHPLNPPQGAPQVDLSLFWSRAEGGRSFADAVDFQASLCDAGRAPKAITTPEYAAVANYAYHLDAAKFAALLADHAITKLGVRHVVADITGVTMAGNGDVAAVVTEDGASIAGDFFVDCSGFRALIIGDVYQVPFIDCNDVLFADHALAMQVPYPRPDAPIASHTISTAQAAGWIWDIGLPTRRGTGYVYSSRHTSHDAAEAALRAYIGPAAEGISARRIPIRSGHRERFWVNNAVAVGLSNGFLEPLEASALMLIETAVDFIADRLPQRRSAMPLLARQFNRAFSHHWARIIEFLKLHYVLTQRDDTAFWRDNRDPASVPDDLTEQLQLWRHHPPCRQDFAHQPEVFSWPSYQYVLHGMRFHTDYRSSAANGGDRWFRAADRARDRALAELPSHRALIDAVHAHGLQPV